MSDNNNGLNLFAECDSLLEDLSPTEESTIAGGTYGYGPGVLHWIFGGFYHKRRRHGRRKGRSSSRRKGRSSSRKKGYGKKYGC